MMRAKRFTFLLVAAVLTLAACSSSPKRATQVRATPPAAHCAQTAAQVVDPLPMRHPVPFIGMTPTRLQVCRYAGTRADQRLVGQGETTNKATIDALVRAANAFTIYPPNAIWNCPPLLADDHVRTIDATFGDGTDWVRVRISDDKCPPQYSAFSSGQIAQATRAWFDDLARVAR